MNVKLTKPDSVFLLLVFMPVAPLFFCFLCWWSAYLLLPEVLIPHASLLGLTFGMFLDLKYFPRLLEINYRLPWPLTTAVYLFYSVACLGFFMGVPVFNILLGVLAGIFIGRKVTALAYSPEKTGEIIRYVSAFTTLCMGIVCLLSAVIALGSPSTPSDLEGMFNLSFTITPLMLWGIVLVGGTLLITAQYALTYVSAKLTLRFSSH